MQDKRAKWLTRRLRAIMWRCGDEVCDCYQPEIYLAEPNYKMGYPWDILTIVWQGTFCSDPDTEEGCEQKQELIEAAERFEIPFDEKHLYGERAVRSKEIVTQCESPWAGEQNDGLRG